MILRLEGPDDDSDDSHDPDPESWSTRISTPGRIRVRASWTFRTSFTHP